MTNLDILRQQYSAIFDSVLSNVRIPDSSVVVLRIKPSGYNNEWLVKEAFVNRMTELGRETYFQPPGDPAMSIVSVTCQSIANDIQYKVESESLITKSVQIELYIQILHENKILLAETIAKRFTDQVPNESLDRLEHDQFPFTHGDKPIGIVGQLIEPAIVTAVTAGIIYVFYSYRSK